MIWHQGNNSRGNRHYNAYTYSNVEWKPHFHKGFELIYAIKGEIEINVNDGGCRLCEGQFALLLSNQIHAFRVNGDAMVWVAVFSEDFVPEFALRVKEKQGTRHVFEAEDTVREMLFHHLIFSEPSDMMRRACLLAICNEYLKCVPLEQGRKKNDLLIIRVLDYVEAHYTENITLRSVAQEFGYEYHYLSRLFNKGYNIRFRDILNAHRLESAVRELERGEKGITEIALACGFQSIRTFNEIFFAEKGVSPREYRAVMHETAPNCKKTVNKENSTCKEKGSMV